MSAILPSVTLDGQQFLFRVEAGPLPVDVNGVEWILTKFDGWAGRPAPRTGRTPRPGHPGAFRAASYTDTKIVNLEIIATAPDVLTMRNAEIAMAGLCSDGAQLYEMVVSESGFTRAMMVELDDSIIIAPRSWNSSVFSMRLAAPDPRKHDGAWQSPIITLGTPPSGGASFASPGLIFASFVDYGTPGQPSAGSVINSGTAVAYPFFVVTGPLPANWQIVDITNGVTITYTKALSATDIVTINADNFPTQGFPGHGVYLNNTNNQRASLLTPGGWPYVLPKQSVVYNLRSTTFATAASLTASLRGAWH